MIASAGPVLEPVGVESQQMQQSCVVVGVTDGIHDRFVAEVVRGSMDITLFEAATCDPHAKALRIVITPESRLIRKVALNHRSPSHFAAPVNDRRVE